MWLLLGWAFAGTADTADTADTAPYQDTGFVVEPTYAQTQHGCGEVKMGAALTLAALFRRFGRAGGSAPRSRGSRRGAPPTG